MVVSFMVFEKMVKKLNKGIGFQMSTEMCYIIVGRTKILAKRFGLLIKFVCVRTFSVTAILKHAACCFRTI